MSMAGLHSWQIIFQLDSTRETKQCLIIGTIGLVQMKCPEKDHTLITEKGSRNLAHHGIHSAAWQKYSSEVRVSHKCFQILW